MELSEKLQKIAQEELGETPEIREKTLRELHHLLKDKKDIFEKYVTLDDAFLLRFLRVSKFNVQKAYGRINTYFDGRKRYREDYDTMNAHEAANVVRRKILQMLPTLTSDNRLILCVDVSQWDPKEFHLTEIIRTITIILERLLELQDFPEFQILGINIILETKTFSMRHFLQCSPNLLIKMALLFLKMIPLRISSLNYMNESRLVKLAFNIAYPFMPDKIKKRIHFHGPDCESLHKLVDKEAVTPNLGGTGKEMDIEYWLKRLFPELNE